jgi:hypothetical protein
MYAKTLTKYEKDIIDNVIITYYDSFDIAVFNHAIANTLPTWRCEQLVDTNNSTKKTIAYIDYVKDFLKTQNKA